MLKELQSRLVRAKAAYSTRYVDFKRARNLVSDGVRPRAGDLLLAQIEQVGHHKNLELRHGRKATLFPGDEIVVCYGDRYAPDQFEAEICEDLRECDLVAAGGIASCVVSRFAATRSPTRIRPVGLLGDIDGAVLNLRQFCLAPAQHHQEAYVIAVVGAAMNTGKTTTAVSLIRGLTAAGYKVGAAKVTGTSAGGDLWQMVDAGAEPALDITAAGLASTYRVTFAELLRAFETLTSHALSAAIDVLIVEVADGIYQKETAVLVQAPEFKNLVNGVCFASRDAPGAKAGVDWLIENGHAVLALSGALTMSPLAAREARAATGLTVLTPDELQMASVVERLALQIPSSRRAA
jgi:hypothetical protein